MPKTTHSVRVRSMPGPFGPTRQSFEITNGSKDEVTVFLERSGSDHFSIPDASRKRAVKPGRSVRAEVEFTPPHRGMVMTASSTYRAAIKVWVRGKKDGTQNTLVDIVNVTGTAPGVIARPLDLRCFDPGITSGSHEPGRRRE